MPIHETAIISKSANIAPSASIGPYCVVEDSVEIGEGTILESHVVVKSFTKLGRNNRVGHGTVLGAEPQDVKFRGEKSFLEIGDNNVFREFVTIHRACGEGEKTTVGSNNFFMSSTHVGHNCRVEEKVVLTNLASLSGHCVVERGVTIGGMAGLHQFVRIGAYSFVGGRSGVRQDVPPFALCQGDPCRILGVNVVGLKRNGFDEETIAIISAAYRKLFFSRKVLKNAIAQLQEDLKTEATQQLLAFLRNSRRGIIRAREIRCRRQ